MQAKKIWGIAIAAILVSFTSTGQVGQILWEDNFNTLNTDIWNVEEGDGCPDLCGFGNEELQYYQNENVNVEEIPGEPGNFALVLEAKSESAGGRSFTSAKVTSKNKLGLMYGMIELRIKVPDDLSQGLWPAAWMLGTNEVSEGWPMCGEMDLMEMGQSTQFRNDQGFPSANENNVTAANVIWYTEEACGVDNPDCVASISSDMYYNQPYVGASPLTNRFLIYRLYWDEDFIRLTVEDNGLIQNFYTGPFPLGSQSSEFRKPFYLLMNLAVGGNFTDAVTDGQVTADLPGKMYIDYVRVRQWNGLGEVFTPEKLMPNAGADKTLDAGEMLHLNATGSYGPIATYSWKINGIEEATTAEADLALDPGSYNVELTITDGEGNSAKDEIQVFVGNDALSEIIWEDDFSTFNPDIWNKDVGDGCDEGLCGWGNEELQSYQEDNVYIEEMPDDPGNFALVLEAKSELTGNSAFTSGKVTTENKLAIKHGVVEVRMKVPDLQDGLWPAAWLLGINHRTHGWPVAGEIDMMEMGHDQVTREAEGYFGSPNNFVGGNVIWYTGAACAADNLDCAASIAFDKGYTTPYATGNAMNDRYMTYRMYWNDSHIRLTAVDNGVEHDLYSNPFPLGSDGTEAFKKPFYFILNLAVGGRFTGILNDAGITTPFPAKMYIDYVRVSRWNGQGEVSFLAEELTANAGADMVEEDLDMDGVESVMLDGSFSTGDIVAYEWSENDVVLSQDQLAALELSTGVHNIQLKVLDADGNESVDLVKVEVRELLWGDDFDTFDTNYWTAEVGDGCPDLCGNGNDELQNYQTENVSIEVIPDEPDNNALAIVAKSEMSNGHAFTSGKVVTQDKVSIRYGLVETRLKVPDDLSTGLWPAAWLLGTNIDEVGWPRSGEIDMMEMGHKNQVRIDEGFPGTTENDMVGANVIFYSDEACGAGNPDCAASIAFDQYYTLPYVGKTPISTRFLTYRMYWDPNQIRLTAEDEGVEFDLYTGPFPLGADAEEFHKPFFFLLNLAVGGNFTDATSDEQVTADLPAKMLVDYVRVFRWNGVGEVSTGSGPIANAGADIISLDENEDGSETITLDGSGSSHHNGEIVSYSWSVNEEVIATGITAQVDFSRGDYEVVLTVTDGIGNEATDHVLVKVSNGGLAPAADAGGDQTIEDDNGDDLANVMLNGSATEESNAPITGYRWLENDQELATGVTANIVLSTGIHVITLEVTDEDELIGTDDVVITIIDPDNIPPVADAGGDITLNDDNGDDLVTVQLDGTSSSDSDGSITDYQWFVDNQEIATGSNASIELTTGFYDFTLVVTDDDGVSSSADFMVSLIDPDNQAPVAEAGDDALVIDTNLDDEESFPLDASGSSDADGTIESYSWSENNVEIGNSDQFNANLAVGEHTITLEVTDDDGVSSTDQVFIIVNQLPVAVAGADVLVFDADAGGDETITLDASGSSDANGTIATYSWTYDQSVIGTTEVFQHAFAIGTHKVELEITDNHGSTATDDLVIIVSRTNNEAPVANAGADQTIDDTDNSRDEVFRLDASGTTDDGTIISYVWTKDGDVLAEGIDPLVTLGVGSHTLTLEVMDNEGVSSSDDVVLLVTQSVCILTWCNDDFVAEVLSGDSGTSITFVTEGTFGQTNCLLYYGTGNGPYPGYSVTPNVPFELTNVSAGQTIGFYYTYSSNPETTTNICPNSFVVGACGGAPIDETKDATLSDLLVDGVTVKDFDSDKLEYAVVLPPGTVDVPTITATTSYSGALHTINPSGSLLGVTTVTVTSEDGTSMKTYEVSFKVFSTTTNLALGRPITTSSDENGGTTGASAVDGNTGTRWSSLFADPQWIYVDLGDMYEVGNVVLLWEGAFGKDYEIQVSDDASSWTTIHTETSGNGGTDDLSVYGVGRYVRMYGTARGTAFGYSLFEFEVYGSLKEDSSIDIEFLVKDENQNVLEGAMVSMLGQSSLTNALGSVLFEDLDVASSVSYTVNKTGYDESSGVLDLIVSTSVPVTLAKNNVLALGEQGQSWMIYPNPTPGALVIHRPELVKEATLHIFNSTGQIILHRSIYQVITEIDLSEIPTGMYLLRLTDSEERFLKKIIIE